MLHESQRDFGPSSTERWSCRQGDLVLWARCNPERVFADDAGKHDVADFWEMREGQWVTMTNRLCDLPPWVRLHPLELAGAAAMALIDSINSGEYKHPDEPMDGPNIWRVMAGDSVAWVRPDGRPALTSASPSLLVMTFEESALVVGEPLPTSMEGLLEFGDATEPPPGKRTVAALQMALDAVRKLGVPRTLAMDGWRFGG